MGRRLSIHKGNYIGCYGARTLYELAGKAYYTQLLYEAFGENLDILDPKLMEECMRDISLKRGAHLPHIPILFCNSYGGFELSDSFQNFLDASPQTTNVGRHSYDSVIAFGNFVIHKAPEIVAEYDQMKAKRDTGGWNWSTKLTEFWKAKEQLQSRLIDLLRQQSDLQQWYCARSGPSEQEQAGLKLASGSNCELGVAWVPQMVPYHISEYDGMESVHYWNSGEWSLHLWECWMYMLCCDPSCIWQPLSSKLHLNLLVGSSDNVKYLHSMFYSASRASRTLRMLYSHCWSMLCMCSLDLVPHETLFGTTLWTWKHSSSSHCKYV